MTFKRGTADAKKLNFTNKMASILVYYIILTDNFEKIGLIRVLKSVNNALRR